jgi:hypothetical protein
MSRELYFKRFKKYRYFNRFHSPVLSYVTILMAVVNVIPDRVCAIAERSRLRMSLAAGASRCRTSPSSRAHRRSVPPSRAKAGRQETD